MTAFGTAVPGGQQAIADAMQRRGIGMGMGGTSMNGPASPGGGNPLGGGGSPPPQPAPGGGTPAQPQSPQGPTKSPSMDEASIIVRALSSRLSSISKGSPMIQ